MNGVTIRTSVTGALDHGGRKSLPSSMVRSRLLYSVQTWDLKEADLMKKTESICMRFHRKMVRGGFRRKNPPKKGEPEPDNVDCGFVLSNERILKMAGTCGIRPLFLWKSEAEISRTCSTPGLDNAELEKQCLVFLEHTKLHVRRIWPAITKDTWVNK